MTRALRARLPRTRENSLTWASPAATIHLTYWLVLGSSRDRTRAARTNCQSGRSRSARRGPEHRPQEAGRVRGGPPQHHLGGRRETPPGKTKALPPSEYSAAFRTETLFLTKRKESAEESSLQRAVPFSHRRGPAPSPPQSQRPPPRPLPLPESHADRGTSTTCSHRDQTSGKWQNSSQWPLKCTFASPEPGWRFFRLT